MENRDSGHGTPKYSMRAHEIIKKKSFTNELGNKIKARVTKYDDGRKEPIKIELIGPDSTSEDNVTAQEAGVLADLIRDALTESANGGTFTVYHGTPSTFKAFADPALGSANGTAPINMTGFNFTDNPECARTFGPNVLTCEVTIQRPLVINAKGQNYSEFKGTLNDKLARLDRPANRAKYDGVIITRYADAGIHGDEYIESNHFIPFTSDQIRVVGRETFA